MGEISCPYCKEPLKFSPEIARCSVCRTAHHLVCWQENKGCSVPKCEGKLNIVSFSQKKDAPYLKIFLPLIIALALFLLAWLLW